MKHVEMGMCIAGGWAFAVSRPFQSRGRILRAAQPDYTDALCLSAAGITYRDKKMNLAENLMTRTVAKTSPALGILKIGSLHTSLKIATKSLIPELLLAFFELAD